MDGDLYAALGVEPSCSEDDIKRAYRRLSLTYHPDRRLDAEEKAAAGAHWLRISAAYDVLADDHKRMVYDELGARNLQEGLVLLQSSTAGSGGIANAEDLHREWRRAKTRAAEADHLRRMGVSGSFVISTSAAHVLHPRDPSTPLWRRLLPELSSVAMSEEMRLGLDRRHTLTVSNQAVTKAGLGGSTMRLGFKRALSSRSTLQLGTALSHDPLALDVAASRRLSANSTGSVSANVGYGGISRLTFNVGRQLTRRLVGDLALTLPTLSFFGGAPGDTSILKLQIARSPTRPSPNDDDEGGGGEGGGGEGGAGSGGCGDGQEGGGERATADVPGGAASGGRAVDDAPPPSSPVSGGGASRTPPPSSPAAPCSPSLSLVSLSTLAPDTPRIDDGEMLAPSSALAAHTRTGGGVGGALARALDELRSAADAARQGGTRLVARAVARLRAWQDVAARTLCSTLPALHRAAARATRRRLGHSSAEVVLTPFGVKGGAALTWRHSPRSRSKVAVRVGVGGFSVTLSTERSLSVTSASAGGVALQLSQRGLMIKLRVQRHGHRLLFPIYLAATPTPLDLLLATALPAALGRFGRSVLLPPLRRRARLKAAKERENDEQTEAQRAHAARRAAATEARLLERDAAARAREEDERGGLLILAATYGDTTGFLSATSGGRPPSGSGGRAGEQAGELAGCEHGDDGWVHGPGGGCWLDVRVPLQYLVVESTLRLPAGSKRRLRGFSAPPPPAAPPPCATDAPLADAVAMCRLWVRYRLGNEIRTVCVDDSEAVQLGLGGGGGGGGVCSSTASQPRFEPGVSFTAQAVSGTI